MSISSLEICKKLDDVTKIYQEILEKTVSNYPTGTCYLSAFVLTDYFKKIGLYASVIIGDLALVNVKENYAIYGDLKLKKSLNIGDYHAWCEVIIGEDEYIVDPSIKYNSHFLKNAYNFKTSKKIGESIITNEKQNFYWKYRSNPSLEHHYLKYINNAPQKVIDIIINELLNSKIFT